LRTAPTAGAAVRRKADVARDTEDNMLMMTMRRTLCVCAIVSMGGKVSATQLPVQGERNLSNCIEQDIIDDDRLRRPRRGVVEENGDEERFVTP
jgi:hypothetical protein